MAAILCVSTILGIGLIALEIGKTGGHIPKNHDYDD
jgi:hypothetical protein